MGKRELVALLSVSSWCLVIVFWFFLAVPWVNLQFVIVVFPDHTHLLCLPTKTSTITFFFQRQNRNEDLSLMLSLVSIICSRLHPLKK